MKIREALRDFDFDISLRDALDDSKLSVSRRLLAGVTMGVDLDTAYYSITEMLEAFTALNADQRRGTKIGEGYILLEDILETQSPYQMKVWHLLNDLHIAEAANDLAWLRALTYQRASMFKSANKVTPVRFYPQDQLVEKPTAAELISYKPAEFRSR